MHPLASHYERKTRSDHGKKSPRESNASSSSTSFKSSISFYPLVDTVIKMMMNHFIPIFISVQNISSSSILSIGVRQNPPHESNNLNTYLSENNLQSSTSRCFTREGLRSIGQALKNMMGGKRK
ncbi:hypothetical protein Tco_0870137 [Tanacetum coccineum]